MNKQTYSLMFDGLLSMELMYLSSYASEQAIKKSMKKILGRAIRDNIIKRYSGLVLNENLDVYFNITDPSGVEIPIVLYYGR